MPRKSDRFEHVFEKYLHERNLPYIRACEIHRPTFGPRKIKNLDFVVASPKRERALVDVKGKKHGAVSGKRRQYWENWVSSDDVESMSFWEECFGRGFRAVFVFIYELFNPDRRSDFDEMFVFDGVEYGLAAVPVSEYSAKMRVRSEKWKTRSVPVREFKKLVRPVSYFL